MFLVVENKDIFDAQIVKTRIKTLTRNLTKASKTRRAYIAWQDNDETSSSVSSKYDEEVNLCFMTNYKSSSSSVSFDFSDNGNNCN